MFSFQASCQGGRKQSNTRIPDMKTCLVFLEGISITPMPFKGPQPGLVCCFRKHRDIRKQSWVVVTGHRQDSTTIAGLDCAFVKIALVSIVLKNVGPHVLSAPFMQTIYFIKLQLSKLFADTMSTWGSTPAKLPSSARFATRDSVTPRKWKSTSQGVTRTSS